MHYEDLILWLLFASSITRSDASYCLPIEGARLNGHYCWFSTSVYCRDGMDQSVIACPNGCLNGFCMRILNCSAKSPLFLSLVYGTCHEVVNQSGFTVSTPFDYGIAEYDMATFSRKYEPYMAASICRDTLTALLCERAYTNCELGTQPCIDAAARASAACPGLNEEMNYNSLCSVHWAETTTTPMPMGTIVVLSLGGSFGIIILGFAITLYICDKCRSNPRCCCHLRCLKWGGIGCKKC